MTIIILVIVFSIGLFNDSEILLLFTKLLFCKTLSSLLPVKIKKFCKILYTEKKTIFIPTNTFKLFLPLFLDRIKRITETISCHANIPKIDNALIFSTHIVIANILTI